MPAIVFSLDGKRRLVVLCADLQKTFVTHYKEEAKAANRVVDMEFVFKTLQIFNRGDFDKLTPIEQRGLIDDFVHRITLGKNRIHAEYYGQANTDIFGWDSGVSGGKKTKKNLEGPRSGVLPSIKLVEATYK